MMKRILSALSVLNGAFGGPQPKQGDDAIAALQAMTDFPARCDGTTCEKPRHTASGGMAR